MKTDGMAVRRSIVCLSIKKARALLCALFAILAFSRGVPSIAEGEALSLPEASTVCINEVCASNAKSLKDADGESPDWIELYNPQASAVSLRGWRLTDDLNDPDAFVFENATIEPYGYLLVFASKKQNMLPELHADFKLSSEGGESVYLIDRNGDVASEIAVVALDNDMSYGRRIDGHDLWERLAPTPGGSNNTADVETLRNAVAPPAFSMESGFYDADIRLTLSAGEGSKIYYTLDGSDPDEQSALYSEPIALSNATLRPNVYSMRTDLSVAYQYTPAENAEKCNIVRAIAVDAEGKKSEIASNSYFIGLDRAVYEGVSVVSIVTDPDNLFDYDSGIYVNGAAYDEYLSQLTEESDSLLDWQMPANYRMKGREWEREASFTYFDTAGNSVFSQQIGLRVHGQASRLGIQKSLRLYARREYDGNNAFLVNLFDGVSQTNTMLLRTAGTDSSYTKLRDVFFQSLAADRDVDIQQFIPCVVFLDGEYWGLYNLMQRTDSEYIEARYGIDEDNVVTASGWGIKDGQPGDEALYSELKQAIAMDLSIDRNYQTVCSLLDVQSLIDHFCAELFAANYDWPINNTEMWRSRTVSDREYEDGLWRQKMIDMDYTAGFNSNASYDTNTYVKAKTNEIFAALLANETFRERFALTMMDMLNQNFAIENTVPKLDKLTELYSVHMDAYFRRFIRRESNNAFETNIAVVRDFLIKRPAALIEFTKQELALQGDAATLTINVDTPLMGVVRLNTIAPDLQNGQWQGQYFTDTPVSLIASANEGYEFSHWELTNGNLLCEATDPNAVVRLSALGTTIKAVFAKSDEVSEVLAAFEYSAESAESALTGNSTEGYKATGGLFAKQSSVFASVTAQDGRKLSWSKENYENGAIPVMSANDKNRWSEGAYFDFTLSTKGFEAIELTASFGASEKGPRNLSLQYSLNGIQYMDIKESSATLSKAGSIYTPYSHFALPSVLNNRDQVHIRVCVSSATTIRGKGSLLGSDEGELGIGGFTLSGTRIPLDYGDYDALIESVSAIHGIPREDRETLDELLGADMRLSAVSQAEIESAIEAILEELDDVVLSRNAIESFAPFFARDTLDSAATVNLYDGIRYAVGQIAVSVPFDQKAYIYRLSEDASAIIACGEANVHSGTVLFSLTDAGQYLLLPSPASAYQYRFETSEEPLTEEFIRLTLLDGDFTAKHLWLEVESIVEKPCGSFEMDIGEYGFASTVYLYEADSRSFVQVPCALSDGVIAFETTGGRYLLLSESIEDIRAEKKMADKLRSDMQEGTLYKQSDSLLLSELTVNILLGLAVALLFSVFVLAAIKWRGRK